MRRIQRGGQPAAPLVPYNASACETVMARALALGFVVGLPIAASPGPIFVLVLRRTLSRGSRSGVVSGLGVATGDACYAALAAFGVAAITNVLLGQRRWIGLIGGVAIALISLRMVRSSPHPGPPRKGKETEEKGLSWTTGRWSPSRSAIRRRSRPSLPCLPGWDYALLPVGRRPLPW